MFTIFFILFLNYVNSVFCFFSCSSNTISFFGFCSLDQDCSIFYVKPTAKFDLHVGNMKFSTQNEECISTHMYNCPYAFLCMLLATKM